jgi:hypothetical protein
LNQNPEGTRKSHRNRNIALILTIVALVGAALWFEEYTSSINGCFCGGSPIVTATPVSCNVVDDSCIILLTNTGNSGTNVIGCSFSGTGGGSGILETSAYGAAPAGGIPVPAGGNVQAACDGHLLTTLVGSLGTQVTGQVQMSNSGFAPFSGAWQ